MPKKREERRSSDDGEEKQHDCRAAGLENNLSTFEEKWKVPEGLSLWKI